MRAVCVESDSETCSKGKNKEIILLLQNSWHNKIFIEISSQYLKVARGKLLWVTSNTTTITDEYPLLKGVYFETFHG
jgi:hypothetical protein